MPRATKKLVSFAREITSTIIRPAQGNSYFDWKISGVGKLEKQRQRIIRAEEMVRILFWRRLVINFASFVPTLEQKTRGRSTVNGSKCRRWNGKLAEGVIFLARRFHIQNCPRSDFSLNLNLISKIRTEAQIEFQLRIRIFELKFKLSGWKLDWKFELQSTDLCLEVKIQVLNSRPNFQDRVKNARTEIRVLNSPSNFPRRIWIAKCHVYADRRTSNSDRSIQIEFRVFGFEF